VRWICVREGRETKETGIDQEHFLEIDLGERQDNNSESSEGRGETQLEMEAHSIPDKKEYSRNYLMIRLQERGDQSSSWRM